jgi:hypothetical protein
MGSLEVKIDTTEPVVIFAFGKLFSASREL